LNWYSIRIVVVAVAVGVLEKTKPARIVGGVVGDEACARLPNQQPAVWQHGDAARILQPGSDALQARYDNRRLPLCE
jgi:hypothetical protein